MSLTDRGAKPPTGDGDETAASVTKPARELRDLNDLNTLKAVAELHGIEFVELRPEQIADRETMKRIPKSLALNLGVIAIRWNQSNETLTVATADPNNLSTEDQLKHLLNCTIAFVVSPYDNIIGCIEVCYADAANAVGAIVEANSRAPESEAAQHEVQLMEDDPAETADAVRIVNTLLRLALDRHASDISIEPRVGFIAVRIKVDGTLLEVEPPLALGWAHSMISRIKILAGMVIEQTRQPQDGSFRILRAQRNRHYDIRVASLPIITGEMVTLRILDPLDAQRTLGTIGLTAHHQEILHRLIALPNGVILVTGPTGSGKTTTLYACIGALNTPSTKIITIEDPVEYRVDGINQMQVNHVTGFGFADGLRASLRQAPNVILIGEMRDVETAEIAMRAALTGHLVFSTLHTNSAAQTAVRLTDMGVEPFLTASSLRAIIAQRLVRTLCDNCFKVGPPNPKTLEMLGLKAEQFQTKLKQPGGCESCFGQGFRGRTAIHEILVVDSDIERAIIEGISTTQLEQMAVHAGMFTLKEDGTTKVAAGDTTLEEILNVVGS